MLFGFSTLGSPTLSFEGASDLAAKFGFQFIELRVLEGNLDLPAYFSAKNLSPETISQHTAVRVLGSSLSLSKAQPADIEKFLLMAELADKLNAPYIRIFGGGRWGDPLNDELLNCAQQTLRQIRTGLKQQGRRVEILLETHDAFSSAASCLALNRGLDTPLNIIWDSHHTWKLAGESPQETWARMSPLIRHVHYKDSYTTLDSKGGYRYTLPGEGEFPTKALFHVLKTNGYSAGVSLESEKHWRPEIPEIELMLAAFKKVIGLHAQIGLNEAAETTPR